jgi:hypothetical protein
MVSVSVAPENLAVLPFDIDADSINGTGDLIHVFSTDDDATTIETTDNPDINWGVSFRTPTDLIVTAENPRLTDSYTYESFSGQETKRAPEGRQFAFIDISVSNDAFETRSTPGSSLFELAAANEQVEPLNFNYERDDDYIGSTNILSDVTESGVLPYEIPSEASIDDLRLFYDDLASTGDGLTNWKVTWESIDAPDVEIVRQTLDPPEINADSSRTHTLSFDALNVSTDGGQDDFTVELPDKVELLEVTDLTVTRGSADAESDVEYSFTDNTITFSVNFDASQRVQDMSFDVVMSLTANDTATDG